MRNKLSLLAFIGPSIFMLILLRLFPVLYTFFLSFQSWSLIQGLPPRFIGFENYFRIFNDYKFWESLSTTVKFTFLVVPVEFIIGFGIALLLNHINKLRNFLTSIIIMPMMIIPVVVGVLWRMIFQQEVGVLNYLLNLIGINAVNWLGEQHIALTSIGIVDIWQWTPFMILILLAGLQTLPGELYEAASIEGANTWQTFRFITIPLIRPIFLVALIMRSMDAIRIFDTIFVLTEGGPGNATDVLSIMTFRSGFRYFDMGYTAALTIIFLLLILCISLPYILLRKVKEGE